MVKTWLVRPRPLAPPVRGAVALHAIVVLQEGVVPARAMKTPYERRVTTVWRNRKKDAIAVDDAKAVCLRQECPPHLLTAREAPGAFPVQTQQVFFVFGDAIRIPQTSEIAVHLLLATMDPHLAALVALEQTLGCFHIFNC